jgi:hypothetical protein
MQLAAMTQSLEKSGGVTYSSIFVSYEGTNHSLKYAHLELP